MSDLFCGELNSAFILNCSSLSIDDVEVIKQLGVLKSSSPF